MEADYLIVGAGSAGCAMAYRLSEAGKSVIVIEQGGTDAGPFIQMPAALSYPMNMSRYDWGYRTEPESHLGGRRLLAPRGKVIGGSSSINGMVYVRGHPLDYDHWSDQGAQGWGHSDILPYFKRLENCHGGGQGYDTVWRGANGPLHVTPAPRKTPLGAVFVEAAQQAGYEVTEDYNGRKQEGFGPFENTIWKGRRWSTANAYLRPALKRKNCVLLSAFVRRVVIQDGRAVGVEVMRNHQVEVIRARCEVVIAASAFNSPKILMLSGIGPGDHLTEHGIEPLVHRPGVGQNLQDHLEVYFQMASKLPVTLYRHWNPLSKALIGARWLLTKGGLGSSNNVESAGFIRSRAGVEYPDIQFHFVPIAARYDGQIAADGHGFQAHVGPTRSLSRGKVTLRSSKPEDSPRILFNYMSNEKDWVDFRTCLRLTRELFSQRAFEPFVKHEILPGANAVSDEDLDAFVVGHAESAYHPCGTCKMGNANDPMAVVDPECRVIGVDGLRVADSSIFPRIPNGNTNAPSIMVGEKASDHLLGRPPLPRESAQPWVHPAWQTAQR